MSFAFVMAVECLVVASSSRAAGTEMNLGVMTVGQSLEHRIHVVNEGTDALTITNVGSSCECLHILSYPPMVPPVSTGEIAVKVVAEMAGAFRYEVTVETTDKMSSHENLLPERFGGVPHGDSIVANWRCRTNPLAGPGGAGPGAEPLPPDRCCPENDDERTAVAFVDVREKRAYEAGHIRGAMNRALHAVKSAGFLRARTVVLVDEGWGNPALRKRMPAPC